MNGQLCELPGGVEAWPPAEVDRVYEISGQAASPPGYKCLAVLTDPPALVDQVPAEVCGEPELYWDAVKGAAAPVLKRPRFEIWVEVCEEVEWATAY